MSVAGIFASSLFSNPTVQIAQKVAGWAASAVKDKGPDPQSGNLSGAQSVYGALQQKLALQSPACESSISAKMMQLGQDLKSGNLTAAQADSSSIHQTLNRIGHQYIQPVSNEDGRSQSGTSQNFGQTVASSLTDPLMAAFQAYSSLQQTPFNAALRNSLAQDLSTISIDA